MIKYQGEEIDFSIEVVNQDGSVGDLAQYVNVIVYAKCGCHLVKYSLVSTDGHQQLVNSDNILLGLITANDTFQMFGDLEFELMTVEQEEDGKLKIGIMPQENSGIKIIKPI